MLKLDAFVLTLVIIVIRGKIGGIQILAHQFGVQMAVQMVDLVAQRAGQQTFALHLNLAAFALHTAFQKRKRVQLQLMIITV